MLARIGQIWFGICLLSLVTAATAFGKLVSLCGLPARVKQGIINLGAKLAFGLSITLSPWIRVTSDQRATEAWSSLDMQPQESRDKSIFIMGNHTSFLDTLLSTKLMPWSILYRSRCMGDASLFRMPIFGTLVTCAGHFPVYFTTAEDGKFSVDKVKNAEVDKRVDEHLHAGGHLCIFPEGTRNKTPDTLMSFRLGGMRKALDFDARIMAIVSYNNTGVWPRKASVGGIPGRIRYSVRCLAPNGVKAYLAALRAQGGDKLQADDRELPDHELLGKYLRLDMQRMYDECRATAALGGGEKTD